jgi:acyl carrier protein
MELDINLFIEQLEEEFDEDIKPGTLKPDSNLEDTLELTSVNALILISLVKVEYDVAIEADEFTKCVTVSDVFDVIKKKTA